MVDTNAASGTAAFMPHMPFLHPTPERPLRLGTRASPLAMVQAHETRDRLLAAHGWQAGAITILPVTASGDKVAGSLADAGGKALWTKELDQWLHAGEIDFAVHCVKDMETIRPDFLAIAAILPREDVRDCLIAGPGITAPGIEALPHGARLATSAPRRAAQALHLRPDLTIVPIRGNVATRLAKLEAGLADATLLAMGGLNRLACHIGTPLPAQSWLPAAGQAAIAIETRRDNAAMLALLGAIDDAPSRHGALAERALLAALGGNCHSAVAVLTTSVDDGLHLTAALYSPDGALRVAGEACFAPGDHAPIAALAADLLARAPAQITDHFTGPA
jgi:hydroxymethylbilane synthase